MTKKIISYTWKNQQSTQYISKKYRYKIKYKQYSIISSIYICFFVTFFISKIPILLPNIPKKRQNNGKITLL